jgi:hypothetical protein
MAGTRRAIWRMLAAGFGLASGIVGAEMTFGQLRAKAEPGTAAVLYSIELRNQQGELLASPMVVGQEGHKVHVELAPAALTVGPHSEPLAMSLDLTPQPYQDGLCLDFKLSTGDGSVPHHGHLSVPYGPHDHWVPVPGLDHLQMSLRVARAHTAEFEQLLQAHRYRPAA